MCHRAVERQMSTGLQRDGAQPSLRDGRRWGEQRARSCSKQEATLANLLHGVRGAWRQSGAAGWQLIHDEEHRRPLQRHGPCVTPHMPRLLRHAVSADGVGLKYGPCRA